MLYSVLLVGHLCYFDFIGRQKTDLTYINENVNTKLFNSIYILLKRQGEFPLFLCIIFAVKVLFGNKRNEHLLSLVLFFCSFR